MDNQLIAKLQLDLLKESLEKAGEIILNYFGESLQIENKTSVSDVRTKADIEVEKYIIACLVNIFPYFNISGEGTGFIDNKSEYTLHIDPIEGTSNFVLGIPVFVINVGLMHKQDIIAGFIYNPITKDYYGALKGQGAYLNDKQIFVNGINSIEKSVIDYNFSYSTPNQLRNWITENLRDKKIKRALDLWCGGYSFCLLASGKIEAVLVEGDELYDFIAGKLIAKEAGALITDFNGEAETNMSNSRFIASNGQIVHLELVSILTGK